ncbi:hypothetical protein [Kriegella aquimaris]|uniref:DUF748 domain-containing protein n=1 Tax=Kriegella aquimaris TaxID=192904 RepID=A0A1G9R9N5_9FLAO|nr:hypothetical protein [Kriegella aquimaris]SDM19851.1 hypothetical protein SAMN04488514_10640 [Kriegella aquimaris]
MTKNKKRNIAVTVLIALGAIILSVFAVSQVMAEDMISNFLKRKIPRNIELTYDNVQVNIFKGNLQFEKINLDFYERDSSLLQSNVQIDQLTIDDFGYWNFFVKNAIHVDAIKVYEPNVHYFLDRILPQKDTVSRGIVQLLKTIEVDEIVVEDGNLLLLKDTKDSIKVAVKAINFLMTGGKTSPELIKNKIPLQYDRYELTTDDVFIDLGLYEILKVTNLELKPDKSTVKNLSLVAKLSKKELSKQLRSERDHIDLKIPLIEIEDIDFGFKRKTFFLNMGQGLIKAPNLEIYRDKLVPDDYKKKKLYSQMLRELPINLSLSKINIENGRVSYSERVTEETQPAPLVFGNLKAVLKNISNNGANVSVEAEAKLMNEAQLKLNWSFEDPSKNDRFRASGVVKDFKAASINDFLTSNLRARAKGTVNELYFTVSGNAISSKGDMKMKYENFEFSVLKKDRLGINKFLTTIGKLFINDGSKTAADGFRYGVIDVERDPTKSFFNYLWINVQDGTLSTITGKAKKKE